ncbi:hypothetical protein LIL_50042 (plasmid) [Leptospira interrogans serovar Linhai str. 56609]|nr:hypothetical protein LIL_50042 [Leptospira interrogans serovar Linhai str. 56609]KGE21802.1 hypothetical protein IQ65_21955 [Leptospira interrogans serovar Lai]QOI36818.1 hypothetical protein LeptoLang_21775 [Leptospira interrogans serovar Icterohaemorrhagiae]
MKFLFCLILGFTTLNCGFLNKLTSEFVEYSKVCVNGVTYLQFPSGVAVQVDQKGIPVSCE